MSSNIKKYKSNVDVTSIGQNDFNDSIKNVTRTRKSRSLPKLTNKIKLHNNSLNLKRKNESKENMCNLDFNLLTLGGLNALKWNRYWKKVYDSPNIKQNTLKFKDILQREFGYSGRIGHGFVKNFFSNTFSQNRTPQTPREFSSLALNSLEFVRKLKESFKLSNHEGCVNALNFNRIGTLLCSGSDDCDVCIWDYAHNSLLLSFDSGHISNIFQTKFIPFTGDTQIVTSARDGQVRLSLISSSGTLIDSKRVAKHSDSCHKLSIEYDSSNLFLSCGEDGVVFEIDLRQSKPAKILVVRDKAKTKKIPLCSISSNQMNTYEFIVAGGDQFVRLYDKRMLADGRGILKKFFPHKLKDSKYASITCAAYNHNGTEIVASYSDESIYLFETNQDSKNDFKFSYNGHLNSDTVKGITFYGSYSDYIISGSDCGNIFFWEKTTQQIVQVLKGNERQIVNVIEPNPYFPIIATSGLDYDISIWEPLDSSNELENLSEILNENKILENVFSPVSRDNLEQSSSSLEHQSVDIHFSVDLNSSFSNDSEEFLQYSSEDYGNSNNSDSADAFEDDDLDDQEN